MADVGLAHVVHASHIAELDALGTFAYAAPELLSGDKCNEKADIWYVSITSSAEDSCQSVKFLGGQA